MSTLTYLMQAEIRDSVQQIEGEILTRPALIKSDGSNITYAADVKIAGYDDPLRNVPVAMGNRELTYADVGQAVTLTRTLSGTFEISGFAKKKPGTRTRVPVDLGTTWGETPGQPGTPPTAGDPDDVTLRVYRLTYGDLGDPQFGGGYGTIPYGAYALYRGDTLVHVRW